MKEKEFFVKSSESYIFLKNNPISDFSKVNTISSKFAASVVIEVSDCDPEGIGEYVKKHLNKFYSDKVLLGKETENMDYYKTFTTQSFLKNECYQKSYNLLKKNIYLIALISNFFLLNLSMLSFSCATFDDFINLNVTVRGKLAKKRNSK